MNGRVPVMERSARAVRAMEHDGLDRSRAGEILRRSFTLTRTFGLTTSKYGQLLRRYREILSDHGQRGTFPTTAVTLQRHPAVLQRLADAGNELAVHGLTHIDHSRRDLEAQTDAMTRARAMFRQLGFSPEGFRCPYLWWNDATPVAARRAGFSYVSNQAYLWGDFDCGGVRRLYHVAGRPPISSLPFTRSGIIEIPVSLPDDFLLAVRWKLGPDEIAAVWSDMLSGLVRKGEMLTLELHPELLPQCAPALIALLRQAGEAGEVWIPTLAEVARWWRTRRDFDAVATPGDGRLAVTVRAPPDSALEVRKRRSRAAPTTGSEWRPAPDGPLDFPGDVIPFVAVPPTTGDEDLLALRERGFVCRITDEPRRYGAHLTARELRMLSIEDRVARIEAADGPLLRLRPWPKGKRAALCVTGDVDCLTLWDYAWRLLRR